MDKNIISKIEKYKKLYYNIFINNEYFTTLHSEVLDKFSLKEGKILEDIDLEDIKIYAEERKARERCLYLISYRDHSWKELYEKLLKSVSEEVARKSVQKMEDIGLIDDIKYGMALAKKYLVIKKWGFKKAKYELSLKGISSENIDIIFREYQYEVDILDNIKFIIEKKHKKNLLDYKGNQKIIASLLRMGHSYSDIKIVIDDITEDINTEDINTEDIND